MAVFEEVKGVKVVLNLVKGSQTIAGCKEDATSEELHTLGSAVAMLQQEALDTIVKVQETLLIQA
jgi:hypothetical protein